MKMKVEEIPIYAFGCNYDGSNQVYLIETHNASVVLVYVDNRIFMYMCITNKQSKKK